MPPKKVKLEICGSSYVISTSDPEEYLMGLAERLDHDMNEIMMGTPNASVTAAAVITALGYLDEAEKSAFGADNLRAQLQDYLEDASRARLAAEEARREAERLRRELAYFEGKGTPRQNAAPAATHKPAPPSVSPAAPAAVPVQQVAPQHAVQPAPAPQPVQQAAYPAAPPAVPGPQGPANLPGQMGIEDVQP